MADSLILPILNNTTSFNPYRMDCSDITIQLCQALNSNMNLALFVMGLGLALSFSRKYANRFSEKYNEFKIVSDYLDTSIFPELLVLVSFIFLVYIRVVG